jgi:hypothetical protein
MQPNLPPSIHPLGCICPRCHARHPAKPPFKPRLTPRARFWRALPLGLLPFWAFALWVLAQILAHAFPALLPH